MTEGSGPVPYAAAARSLLRDTVIDAVDGLARARGWSATTMTDVARAAGVSRQTLYNEFGSKDGLAVAMSAAQTEWFLGRIQDELDQHPDDPIAGIRAAIRFTLDAGADDPMLKATLSSARGASDLLPLLTTRSAPMISQARRLLVRFLHQHHPRLSATYLGDVADTLVRATLSHLVAPAPDELAAERLHRVARHLVRTPPAAAAGTPRARAWR